MIKLDKDTLRLMKSYAPHMRHVILFGNLDIEFWKYGKGEYLHWRHPSSNYGSKYDLQISHRGKLTWHSIKKTLELYLNYHNSHLRRVIMKEMFKRKES